jgi:glycosyltransferase involved in cell wall biosynthesis
MISKTPRVSVGLPVYNGENYLAQAIESILSQTYKDFELILSDNCSTDRTFAICNEYECLDSRVRYYRSGKNFGAAWNFNRVFELASGIYFKWMAHDDLVAPTFLEKCVTALEENHTSVIAYPLTSVIDSAGQVLEEYFHTLRTDSPLAYIRFRDLLFDSDQCYEIFGVIRSECLKRSGVMGNYGHADGVLLDHLSLMGTFHLVPERLSYSRRHSNQSIMVHITGDRFGRPDYHAYTHWFDPSTKGKIIFPNWRILFENLYAIHRSGIPWVDVARCYFYLLKWVKRHRYYLIGDLSTAMARFRFSRR